MTILFEDELDTQEKMYYMIIGHSGWIPIGWMIIPSSDSKIFRCVEEKEYILNGILKNNNTEGNYLVMPPRYD